MTKHTFKNLCYSHHKIFKYVRPFFNIIHERVKYPTRIFKVYVFVFRKYQGF